LKLKKVERGMDIYPISNEINGGGQNGIHCGETGPESFQWAYSALTKDQYDGRLYHQSIAKQE